MRQFAAREPIRVRTAADGRPLAFTWAGRTYRIERVEEVREPRLEWWAPSGEVHRRYYLVVTRRGLICELFCDLTAERPSERWFLGRVLD